MLVSCLAYFSTLKMEATCFYETPVDFQQDTGRYIPEDMTLRNNRCKNVKSYERQSKIIRTFDFPIYLHKSKG
jgi:hypothetical protein